MNLPNHALFEELKKLDFQKGDYAIFGSGPLWVRGIRESNDIDIVTRGKTWEWALKNGIIDTKEDSGLKRARFADGSIEVYNDWYPDKWDIDMLIDTAELVDGIPFVQLELVIEWKKIMGREKDVKDLALIQEYFEKNN